LPITSSLRSGSSGHSGMKRFSSRELRGNLTVRRIDRDPLDTYEIVELLGEGSMGSVAKVKKRSVSSGARTRKAAAVEDSEDHDPVCFRLPFIGGLFRHCTKKSSDAVIERGLQRTVSESSDDLDVTPQLLYAMKSIHLDRCTDQTIVDELKNEVEMLKTLDHPHIVRAIETFEYRNQLYVTMELCSGGDLYTHDPYTEEEAARITMAILCAVSYMHSKGM
jgi:serine/threonine protein kinase